MLSLTKTCQAVLPKVSSGWGAIQSALRLRCGCCGAFCKACSTKTAPLRRYWRHRLCADCCAQSPPPPAPTRVLPVAVVKSVWPGRSANLNRYCRTCVDPAHWLMHCSSGNSAPAPLVIACPVSSCVCLIASMSCKPVSLHCRCRRTFTRMRSRWIRSLKYSMSCCWWHLLTPASSTRI